MNHELEAFSREVSKRFRKLEGDVKVMADAFDDLKQKVADVEASEAAMKARVEALDASQAATAAALQKEIDDLKANPPTGMSDEDAAALAARLQVVVDDMATVDATPPPPPNP